jgi:hypothetical protein
MAWKNLTQRSLADAMLIDHGALKELDEVDELIDCSRLGQELVGIHSKKQGEKAWPPLIMSKALLVQA